MKRFAFVVTLSLSLLAALALVTASPAHASDKFARSLANADGGTTYITTLAPKVSYVLQCTAPACYSTSTSSQTASNCAQDYVLPPRATGTFAVTGSFQYTDAGTPGGALVLATVASSANQLGTRQIFEREFDSALDTWVQAQGLDAGNPGCVLQQRTRNP